jgi:Skp family chaperone for outer membrane proteins
MKSSKGCLIVLATSLLIVLGSTVALAGGDSQSKGMGVQEVKAVEQLGASRYALVIGVNQYADKKIPPLANCENDARALYGLLTDPQVGGLEARNARLLLGPEATTKNIKKELDSLRKIPSSSTVFVFFSGHGAKEADEAYWLTQDTELDSLASSAMSDTDIRRFLERIPCERVVVMLDCCYAAATIKGGQKAVTDFGSVLSRFTGKGRAFLMAAGSGEEAIEAKDLKRGVFTHYLVEGLKGLADADGDGVISLTELTAFIDRKVADEARVRGGIQKPVVNMEVQEPAKFRLTINAERILRNLRETAEVKQCRADRLAKLKQLYLDEKINRDLYQMGERLLNAVESNLNEFDKLRLNEFVSMLEHRLPVDKLQRALDGIAKPEPSLKPQNYEIPRTREQPRTTNIAVAVVDLNRVFNDYYRTPIASAKLKETAAQFNRENEVLVTRYKEAIKELNQLQAANSPRVAQQLTETKKLEEEIKEFRASRQQLLEKQTQQMRQDILQEISGVLRREARAAGYTLVLDKSGNTLNGVPAVIDASEAADVSDEVIGVLNSKAKSLKQARSVLPVMAAVDLNRVFNDYYRTPIASAKLKERAAEFNRQLEQLVADYQRTGKGQQEIEEYKKSHKDILEQETKQMRQDILQEISGVLRREARAAGYTLVLDKSGNTLNGVPAVVDDSGTDDVTDRVIRSLNNQTR